MAISRWVFLGHPVAVDFYGILLSVPSHQALRCALEILQNWYISQRGRPIRVRLSIFPLISQ